MATTGDQGGEVAGAGWYQDSGNPDRERLWTGSRWLDRIRPVKADRIEPSPAAWHPDPNHPGFERLWTGEMWTEEIRRAAPSSAPEPVAVPAPAATATTAAAPWPPTQMPMPAQQFQSAVVYYDDHPPSRLGGLSNWLGISFLAVIAASLAQLVSNQIYIGVENDILNGSQPQLSHVESVVRAVHTTHLITVLLDGITAILFVIWFYRAYRNLVRVGARDLRFGPGWALGGWFIPIFSLFRQKQIANDTWKASVSAGTVGLARRGEVPLSGVLNWWWGTWILGGLLIAGGNGAISRANHPLIETLDSLKHERTGVWAVQLGLVVLIAAAVLAYLFVRDVSKMQDENFEAAGRSPVMETKTCPQCAEQVKGEALVCRYCGHRFDVSS